MSKSLNLNFQQSQLLTQKRQSSPQPDPVLHYNLISYETFTKYNHAEHHSYAITIPPLWL